MTGKVYALILAGGKGERLWPLSRERFPKQFLSIDGTSLFQLTLDRVNDLVPEEHTVIITGKNLQKHIYSYLDGKRVKVIFEPLGKNTAPAIAIGARWAFQKDPNATLLVLPSDHLIRNTLNFTKTIETAIKVSQRNYLVTIGIMPTRPETGYGYIEVRSLLSGYKNAFLVEKFTEKPDPKTAQKFLRSGIHYWNSGIFIYPVALLLDEFKIHQPTIYQHLEDVDFKSPDTVERFYHCVPDISVDYAIMEKSKRIAMVVSEFDWEDLGSLESFKNILHESEGNFYRGNVVSVNSQNNIVISEDNSIIAIYGISNLIVVHTRDVTLVIPRDQAQKVKELLEKIRINPNFLRYWENKPS